GLEDGGTGQHGEVNTVASGDVDRDHDGVRYDVRNNGVIEEGRPRDHDHDDEGMVRSEEQLQVGTERVETGKARLRKYVVTENVTTTVPVEREEVRLEREPITEDERGDVSVDGDLGDEEQQVTLSEERVVVDKETVPVERVSLDTQTVTEEQQVSEEVRKEQVETDVPDGTDTSNRDGR
ncbi:MAG: YsnF/AvaK domain-containing protein, partial [Ornithinimicrobium sp.]